MYTFDLHCPIKKHLLLQYLGQLIFLGTFISSAQAESQFEGWYGQAGVGANEPNLNLSSTPLVNSTPPYSHSITTHVTNSSNLSGVITVGYLKTIRDAFLFGVSLDAHPFVSPANSYALAISQPVITVNGEFQNQSNYALSMTPTWQISPSSMTYLKLGYVWGSVAKNCTTTRNGASVAASQTINLSGTNVGIGFRHILSGQIYAYTELNAVYKNDNVQTNTSPAGSYTATSGGSYYNAIFGIGYRF